MLSGENDIGDDQKKKYEILYNKEKEIDENITEIQGIFEKRI